MEEKLVIDAERQNTGTTWTRNSFFEENGYLILKDLCDPQTMEEKPPKDRGQLNYWGKKLDQVNHVPIEEQVKGSLSRYWYPKYRKIHTEIKNKLEQKLGRSLYETYYYDRFYFPGQDLKKHVDRDACEISVTVHISTNLKGKEKEWPIFVKTPDIYIDESKKIISKKGEEKGVILAPGDGMVYKGCERPHWRTPMPGKRKWFELFKKDDFYYHQIFFHYVLQDGCRSHFAFDTLR
jgi:hypothetical protein